MQTIWRIPMRDLMAGGLLGVGTGAITVTFAIKRGSGLPAALGSSVVVAAAAATLMRSLRYSQPQPNRVRAMVRAANRLSAR